MGYDLTALRSILRNIGANHGPSTLADWLEMATERVYWNVLTPGDSAIDVGAHRGRHTIPMARRVGSAGKVYAIEAASATVEKLKAALNHSEVKHARKMTQIFPVAVADKKGEATFTYLPTAAGMSGLKSGDIAKEKGGGKTEKVKVERLDDLIPASDRKIKFIKLDIEGAELPALQGATRILDRCRPVLTFENGGAGYMKRFNYTAEDFFSFFERSGYVVYTPLAGPFDRAWDDGYQPGQLFATPREQTDAVQTLIAPAMIESLSMTLAAAHAPAAAPAPATAKA